MSVLNNVCVVFSIICISEGVHYSIRSTWKFLKFITNDFTNFDNILVLVLLLILAFYFGGLVI